MALNRGLETRLGAEVERIAPPGGGRRGWGVRLQAAKEDPGPVLRALLSGPGRLCQALAIDRRMSGACLWGRDLFLEAGAAPREIHATERIGVDYAGPWREKPWRFVIAGSPWVSVVRAPRAGGRRDRARARSRA
jgi:3-methyladenine DNA glycosylase Mpg